MREEERKLRDEALIRTPAESNRRKRRTFAISCGIRAEIAPFAAAPRAAAFAFAPVSAIKRGLSRSSFVIDRKSCHMSRNIGVAFCLFALFLSLAGCGRKNPLDSPSAAAARDQKQGDGTTTTTQKPGSADAAKTNQFPSPFEKQSSFVLDPLL
jgi:predicted small lipoprotein YifL